MGAMTLALTMGGLSALSSIASTSQQNRQAQYNKKMAEAQAQAARNQAKVTVEKGRIEAENLDRERNALTRQYADLQAGNVASFGALGVDMSSGSAWTCFPAMRPAMPGRGPEPLPEGRQPVGDGRERQSQPDQRRQLRRGRQLVRQFGEGAGQHPADGRSFRPDQRHRAPTPRREALGVQGAAAPRWRISAMIFTTVRSSPC